MATMVMCDSIKMQLGNIVAVVWHDKRDVRVISSNTNPTDGHVNCRTPQNAGDEGRQLIQVPCPQCVINYSTYIGGVDLAEQK